MQNTYLEWYKTIQSSILIEILPLSSIGPQQPSSILLVQQWHDYFESVGGNTINLLEIASLEHPVSSHCLVLLLTCQISFLLALFVIFTYFHISMKIILCNTQKASEKPLSLIFCQSEGYWLHYFTSSIALSSRGTVNLAITFDEMINNKLLLFSKILNEIDRIYWLHPFVVDYFSIYIPGSSLFLFLFGFIIRSKITIEFSWYYWHLMLKWCEFEFRKYK